MSYDSIVQRQAILVGAGIEAGAGRAARHADAWRGLIHVRGKRASLRVEFDLKVPRIRKPDHLLAGVDHDRFWQNTHHHEFLAHSIDPSGT